MVGGTWLGGYQKKKCTFKECMIKKRGVYDKNAHLIEIEIMSFHPPIVSPIGTVNMKV